MKFGFMETIEDASLPAADLSMIKRMIPHRYPFLMIDKVVNLKKSISAIGIKNITVNEPQFSGHFPDEPIMPGVLVVEAMAQTAAVLVNFTLDMIDKELGIYLLAVDKARFRKKVSPGDVLRLHMDVLRGRGKVWKFEGNAIVGTETVAQAEITALWELKGARN